MPPASPPSAGTSVVPAEARRELDRIGNRWAGLPLDRALGSLPMLRAALDRLSDGAEVPDLGPGVVIDQLRVLVWDAYAAGAGEGVAARLAELRRAL